MKRYLYPGFGVRGRVKVRVTKYKGLMEAN